MYRYWGKARPSDDAAPPYHPLPYHSLDVAAVGQVLLDRHPTLLTRLSVGLGVEAERLKPLLVFLLSIHDLGKFAETFQALQPELLSRLQQRGQTRFETHVRHDSLGYLIWNEALWPAIVAEGWFTMSGASREQRRWRSVFETCLRAVTGHHGQPPKTSSRANSSLLLGNFFGAQDVTAAKDFLRAAAALLLGSSDLDSLSEDPGALGERLRCWSWWLAGFAVLCDWIGSNQDHFRYHTLQMSLEDYWREFAVPLAQKAVDEAAVLPSEAAAEKAIGQLFTYVVEPTPLQVRAAELPLHQGPQLFILEDVTGAGKTEAALVLTHRLMSAGLAEGVYVALPTMATANAMYARMADSYRGLFASDAQPSLVLAHGARDLMEQFRQSVFPPGARDLGYSTGEDSATAQCTAWLADQRKKALLASVGVGTIDQALLGILHSRHQSLRLFGLLGKVLVVDEVHACDAYVNRLLRTLITFHAAAGGSVILLSATLPEDTRRALAEAFCAGAGYRSPDLSSSGYPLLTQVASPGSLEQPLETRPEVRREVEVLWLTEQDDVLQQIREAVAAGRCVCWIRNTVADALAARDALGKFVPTEHLHLFHARYAMVDRLAIEERVLAMFGKNSNAETRTGQVLVATQVVEQSLDLDFDLLISDLAPIDLLIQRAGRLHRHRRDAAGNCTALGEDARGGAKLAVYGPAPTDDASEDWYKAVFPKGAYVYPDHARLWLTARLLTDKGSFRMPEDARQLIEGVYGEAALDAVPEVLQESHFGAEAVALAAASLARQNSLDLADGYVTSALDWWDDTATPTRLGDPVSNVRLARWQNGRVVPWAEADRFAWQRSEVSVRRTVVAAESECAEPERRAAVQEAKEAMPDKGKWSVLLVLEPDGMHWQGKARDGRDRVISVGYDDQTGFAVLEAAQEA